MVHGIHPQGFPLALMVSRAFRLMEIQSEVRLTYGLLCNGELAVPQSCYFSDNMVSQDEHNNSHIVEEKVNMMNVRVHVMLRTGPGWYDPSMACCSQVSETSVE